LKKTSLSVALAAGLALAAASLLTALPASAATVGSATATFLTDDVENSVVSNDGATIAYSGYSNADVWLLDTATNTPTVVTDPEADISEPGLGSFSPDGSTLYVPDYDNGDVVVIDVATATVTGVLTSADFDGPWLSKISPDGNTLYVVDYTANSIVTYDLTADTSSSVISVGSPYYMAMTPDGSTIYNMDYYGAIDVFDTESGLITETFSGPTGIFFGGCTNADVSVLYMPNNSDELYAVSLADGSILASNTTDLPANSENYSCAVSPDDSKVYVTNDDIGKTGNVNFTLVRTPGIITEFAADTLTLGETYEFSGVAYTQMMNFYNTCTAYVAGYYGNAQTFTVSEACNSASGAALANTGVNAIDAGALAAVLTFGGAIIVAIRRRLALK